MKQIIKYKNDYKLSYAEYGDKSGFPLLIQHGLIASITDSDLFARLIEWGARLICIARPGYGESSPYEMKNMGEWADIAGALIDELGLAHFDILGMSSGAPYSYAIGHQFPDKVRNIFILSGTPALFDDRVVSHWPWEVKKDASIAEMQALAYTLFFAQASPQDLEKADFRDAMMNHCFGIGQDFKLRGMDWGFSLSAVKVPVYMRHSRADKNVPLITAQITAQLLANCTLDIREQDEHFSNEVLDDFIRTVMSDHFEKPR